MRWLIEHATVYGLLSSLIGAIIVAFAQHRVFKVVDVWLNSLDFTAETSLNPDSPIVRFSGWEKHMERAVRRSRQLSTLGWLLIIIGVALQILGVSSK